MAKAELLAASEVPVAPDQIALFFQALFNCLCVPVIF